MKLTRLFTFAFIAFAAYSFTACTCDCADQTAASAAKTSNAKNVENATRGESNSMNVQAMLAAQFSDVERFDYDGDMTQLEGIETFGKIDDINSASADADFLKNILNTLMGAENKAAQLDVEFKMSDEPVKDGMFVFAIEAKDEKDLTFQMYDEEGFDVVANNAFKVNEGNNYKVLKMTDFSNGTYVFKLSDDSGKELIRRVEVANEQ